MEIRHFNHIDAFLFDLGGVIINIDPKRSITAFAKLGYKGLEQDINHAHHNGLFEQLEKGLLDEAEFIREIQKTIPTASADAIADAWNAMLLDIPPVRLELLNTLRKDKPVYLLSNTNVIHIREFFKRTEAQGAFDSFFTRPFYSHELGLSKPDPAIFKKVTELAPLNPARTLFLDDAVANIEAAKALGFQTELISAQNTIESYFLGK